MLTEYLNFYLRRSTVQEAVDWLTGIDDSYGLAPRPAALLKELKASLDRDRHRDALRRIESVVGKLGDGDALEQLAARIEELAPKITAGL